MEREQALELWDAIYGKGNEWQTDCFGTWMYRNDYGDMDTKRLRPNGSGKKYNYGWEIDHIRPKSDFSNEKSADLLNNYEPVYWSNNREKADNYPQFSIGKNNYTVVKCDICGSNGLKGYGIINEKGERIDWKGKTKRYFTNN